MTLADKLEGMFYTNKFFDPVDVEDVPQKNIQMYKTTVRDRKKYVKTHIPNAPEIPDPPKDSKPLVESNQTRKETYKRVTAVNVNSADRDVLRYPTASDFEIYLQKSFKNIYKVSLLSTEWPNTDNVVKDSPESVRNNIVAWINEEDGDIGFPVYKAFVRPGTYSPTTLQKEITTKMNLLKSRGGEGPYHSFDVTIDKNTNIITFRRLSNRLLPEDGLAVTTESNDVRVTLDAHEFRVGMEIFISGVRATVGTVKAEMLNNVFVVKSVIDANNFTIELSVPSSVDGRIGGVSTSIGVVKPFKLMFGGERGTIGNIIGFPPEDSNMSIGQQDCLRPKVLKVSNVIIGTSTLFVSKGHGLRSGMTVRISGLDVLPKIDNTQPYTIFSVLDSDSFVINLLTVEIEIASISRTLIGTEVMQLSFPNHGFNHIVSIENSKTRPGAVLVTTLLPHDITPLSTVSINNTDCTPQIRGARKVIASDDDDTFEVWIDDDLKNLGGGLTKIGNSGILGNSTKFQLYNSLDIGSVLSTEINNKTFEIDTILDENNFTFILKNMNTTESEFGGGRYVSISSELHGFDGVITNTDADNNLVRPVTLSGDSYVFLCIRDLGCIVNTGPVSDIFAKILLNRPPGELLFNTHVPTSGKVFDDGLLGELTNLTISVRTHAGAPFTFNNVNFSFTIEVTEIIDTIVDDNAQK